MILNFKKIAHFTLALGLLFSAALFAEPGRDGRDGRDGHGGFPPPSHGGYPPPNHGNYPPPGHGGFQTIRINCDSSGYAFKSCPIYGRILEARLIRRNSHSDCVLGQSWGYYDSQLWVDKGCRGEFEIVYEGSNHGGGDYPPPHYDNSEVISCSSSGYAYNTCYPYNRGYITRVHLIKQNSHSDCREGSSWGYTNQYVWVNNGCRADFRVDFGR